MNLSSAEIYIFESDHNVKVKERQTQGHTVFRGVLSSINPAAFNVFLNVLNEYKTTSTARTHGGLYWSHVRAPRAILSGTLLSLFVCAHL